MTVSSPGSVTPNSSSSARASSGSISAVSASIDAYTPTVPSGRSAGTWVPSSRFATTTVGFSVSGASAAELPAAPRPRARRRGASVSAPRASFARRSAATSSVVLPFARFSAFSSADSTTAVSARSRSARDLLELLRGLGVGAEAAHHDRERVGLAELRDALRARGAARHVDEADLRVDGLARVLHLGEDGESRIGDGDDRVVRLAAVAIPARVRAVNSVDFPLNGTPTSPMSFTPRGYQRRAVRRTGRRLDAGRRCRSRLLAGIVPSRRRGSARSRGRPGRRRRPMTTGVRGRRGRTARAGSAPPSARPVVV